MDPLDKINELYDKLESAAPIEPINYHFQSKIDKVMEISENVYTILNHTNELATKWIHSEEYIDFHDTENRINVGAASVKNLIELKKSVDDMFKMEDLVKNTEELEIDDGVLKLEKALKVFEEENIRHERFVRKFVEMRKNLIPKSHEVERRLSSPISLDISNPMKNSGIISSSPI